jgi:hypothetical protein
VQIIEPLVMNEKPGVFTKAALRISGRIFSN